MMSGRNGPIACASTGQRYPGAISSVTAVPPTTLRRSSTIGLYPGGVPARRAHDAAAGVRRRPAHVEVAHRRRYCAQPGAGLRKKSCSSVSSPWKMLPSVSPNVALDVERRQHLPVQDDVADVRRVLRDGVDHGVAERVAVVVPVERPPCSSFRWYGAYCTKHDITCLPGGATDGSVSDGITMSMYGRREKRPYFASSYACSM
jgi:hypothetical protein